MILYITAGLTYLKLGSIPVTSVIINFQCCPHNSQRYKFPGSLTQSLLTNIYFQQHIFPILSLIGTQYYRQLDNKFCVQNTMSLFTILEPLFFFLLKAAEILMEIVYNLCINLASTAISMLISIPINKHGVSSHLLFNIFQ